MAQLDDIVGPVMQYLEDNTNNLGCWLCRSDLTGSRAFQHNLRKIRSVICWSGSGEVRRGPTGFNRPVTLNLGVKRLKWLRPEIARSSLPFCGPDSRHFTKFATLAAAITPKCNIQIKAVCC